nr:MAG TPA: hypothetical protein [Caudoviricetes sp.]
MGDIPRELHFSLMKCFHDRRPTMIYNLFPK